MIRTWALRTFGVTALIAVGSFWHQLAGLHGSNGLMPAGDFVAFLERNQLRVPTLFVFSASDLMLNLVSALAAISCVLIIANRLTRAALITLWVCWLSLVNVCTPFLNFQWDILLVEATFFFIFYAGKPTQVPRFLLGFLAAKVTFESGLVKILGGDPSWRDLTALTYHWWSQPLPTWSSFVANEMPMWLQKVVCAVTFVFELAIPLLALGPFKLRRIAGWGLITLQAGLFAAGNYSYYNVLAAVIALPLLAKPETETKSKPWHWALAAVVIGASVAAYAHVLPMSVARFQTVNAYGAFAHMTKTRPEIIVEGSNDGITWRAYDFQWKPGRLDVRPKWVAPLQPRLDWQMWFAALSSCGNNDFVLSLQRHLMLGTPEVLALLPAPPFVTPPKFVRTMTYEYRFAPLSEKNRWWSRSLTGPYCPPLSLNADQSLRRASEIEHGSP